ncbi:uncharacterized protein LOC129944856 [Eupeodes corollae]|uniref:uncharacterized protein LOC129944856 n=1 Tax=Eupeodes corollae TaxID=290404 RepID=UPI002491351C|nr:uncharacterized protein LOC129944856 [Eupeodes corollae]
MCRSIIAIFSLNILFSFQTALVFGAHHTKLISFIEKIHFESDSATVFFFGIEDEIVSSFTKKRSDIAVTFFNSSYSQLSNFNDDHRFFSNAILVVQNSCSKCQILDFLIHKIQRRKFLIINGNNLEEIVVSFSYFFNVKKFTRVFGLVGGIAYGYLPFAETKIVRLGQTQPIPNALRNLNGYKFRTVAKEDLPRVFWYTNKRGEHHIAGYIGQLFKHFLKKHNALFTRTKIKDLDRRFMMAVVNATIYNEIDISINAYQDFEGIQLSYPLKLMNWFIVAPLIGNLNPNQYFLRPFAPAVWIWIGLSTCYVIAMDMVRNKLCAKPVKAWESFSQSYLTMLAQPTERPITKAYRFHCQVLLFSFVLVNLYLVYLTSFLTVFIKVKQHRTIQDLIDNQVPVLMVDYEWKLVSVHGPDLAKIVILVEYDDLTKERNSMKNLNFGYALGRDKAKFFIDLQKYPKYHIIYESLKDYYLGFVMAKHSHFSEILNEFIVNICETGLVEKWNRDGIALIKKHKLLVLNTTSNHLNQPYPLSMFHLTFAWSCLTVGLIFSLLVFSIEIFIFKYPDKE